MKLTILTPVLLAAALASTSAFADAGHTHAAEMAIGVPGKKAKADRTVTITMVEPDAGGMAFEPAMLDVKEGETLIINVVNKGELEHELVMSTIEQNLEHKALMEKFPEMEHDDPNAIRLQSGESGELVWTFKNTGEFQFACLIPGHMEGGMFGPITVK